MKKCRKVVAVLMLLSMLLGMLGTSAFASEGGTYALTGRVVDSQTRQPVSGVRVTLMTREWGSVARAETDGSGVWKSGSIPRGEVYRIGFSRDGYEFEVARFNEASATMRGDAYDVGDWEGKATAASAQQAAQSQASTEAATEETADQSGGFTFTSTDSTVGTDGQAGAAKAGGDGVSLAAPVLLHKRVSELTTADAQMAWEPVEGATSYLFVLTDMETDETLGDVTRTTDTYVLLPVDRMAVNKWYSASVAAVIDSENEQDTVIGKPTDWEFLYVYGEPDETDNADDVRVINVPETEEATEAPPLNLGITEEATDAPEEATSPALQPINGEGMLNKALYVGWAAMTGAESYDLYMGLGEPPELVASGLTDAVYTDYVPTEPGVYSAYVVAHVGGMDITSERQNFEVTVGLSVLGGIISDVENVNYEALIAPTPPPGTPYVLDVSVFRNSAAFFEVRWTLPTTPAGVAYEATDKVSVQIVSASTGAVVGADDNVTGQNANTYVKHTIKTGLYLNSQYTAKVEVRNSAGVIQAQGSKTFTVSRLNEPVYAGTIANGFVLATDTSVTWSATAPTTDGAYEWEIHDASGTLVSTLSGDLTTAALPTTSFVSTLLALSNNAVTPEYTLRVRAVNKANPVETSEWAEKKFRVIPSTETFIKSFTYTPATPYAGQAMTFTVECNTTTIPTTTTLLIEGKSESAAVTIDQTTKTFTYTFPTAGLYSVQLSNGANLPASKAETIQVSVGGPTIAAIDIQKKDTAFKITWSAVEGATGFEIEVGHMDGTSKTTYTVNTGITTSYEIPKTVPNKIGPYYVQVTAITTNSAGEVVKLPSAISYFDVYDSSYKSWTGKVKTANVKGYMIPNTSQKEIAYLSKDEEVTVIGASGDFYYVRLGTVATTAVRVFVLKDEISKKSSSGSGGSSGGSGSGSSGGSSGGASGGNISTSGYAEAFGSASVRKSSYSYIPELFQPLMDSISRGETPAKSKTELLATSFSPLPDELNSDQYSAARERAAWNLVTTYLVVMANDVATDDVISQGSAMQVIAGSISSSISEQLSSSNVMDESIRKVLDTVKGLADSAASSGGSASGSKQDVVKAVVEAILGSASYDSQIITEVLNSSASASSTEPLEVQFLRALYALTEYEENKLNSLLTSLPTNASGSEVDATHTAYLDYVFAVAKLHMLAYAFGGAKADTVVKNWGTEIARLIAVNKVYNAA